MTDKLVLDKECVIPIYAFGKCILVMKVLLGAEDHGQVLKSVSEIASFVIWRLRHVQVIPTYILVSSIV